MPCFYEVIPGVLGRSVNFNIAYRFLLRRPVFPDYSFLMTMVKQIKANIENYEKLNSNITEKWMDQRLKIEEWIKDFWESNDKVKLRTEPEGAVPRISGLEFTSRLVFFFINKYPCPK